MYPFPNRRQGRGHTPWPITTQSYQILELWTLTPVCISGSRSPFLGNEKQEPAKAWKQIKWSTRLIPWNDTNKLETGGPKNHSSRHAIWTQSEACTPTYMLSYKPTQIPYRGKEWVPSTPSIEQMKKSVLLMVRSLDAFLPALTRLASAEWAFLRGHPWASWLKVPHSLCFSSVSYSPPWFLPQHLSLSETIPIIYLYNYISFLASIRN